jgi:hypothetical protein
VRASRFRFFRLTLNLNFRLRLKNGASFSILGLLDFDGTTSVVSPWCPCAEHFFD